MTKYLGIIGGLSWASTQTYYRLINEMVHAKRGGQNSAPLLIASVNFQDIIEAQNRGDWSRAAEILIDAGQRLENAGAGAFLIASNTMHLVYDQVANAVQIPGLNIFDAAADEAKKLNLSRLGLLGTRYTMSKSNPFFVNEYIKRGITVTLPAPKDAKRVNEIIFYELIHNRIETESTKFYREVVQRLVAAGAQGVILGCTEIDLILKSQDCDGVPLINTTELHCEMAAKWLL